MDETDKKRLVRLLHKIYETSLEVANTEADVEYILSRIETDALNCLRILEQE